MSGLDWLEKAGQRGGIDPEKLKEAMALLQAAAQDSPPKPDRVKMFEEAPGQTSIRRIVFAIVMLAAMIMCFSGFRWPIQDNARIVALAAIAAAATGVTAGRFAEGMDRRNGQ
jgi:hypothetical protein